MSVADHHECYFGLPDVALEDKVRKEAHQSLVLIVGRVVYLDVELGPQGAVTCKLAQHAADALNIQVGVAGELLRRRVEVALVGPAGRRGWWWWWVGGGGGRGGSGSRRGQMSY